MIFGKTYEDWKREWVPGRWWFAWHPVILQDGRVAWLQYVWRSYRPGTILGSIWKHDEKPPTGGDA